MRIKNLLLAMVTIAALNCNAQTSIPAGNVSGIWTLAGSPYNVQGSIQIVNGTTLTIQPGVTVNFQGTYKLDVQGCLLAIGSVTDTIVFTASNTTNGWRGIRFNNTPITNDTSKIMYCKVQYGKATSSSPYNNGGAFYFNNFSKTIVSQCLISNCLANSGGGGIYCSGSSPKISNNTITNNGSLIVDNYIGGAGIYCTGGSSAEIIGNIISNNTAHNGGGIYCNSSNPLITNNTISTNLASSSSGGGVFCNNCSPTITNNIISQNTGSLSGGGGILCLNSNSQITNNTISDNSGSGIACVGSNSNHATIRDNSISSNSGNGVYFSTQSTASSLDISNNTISFNTDLGTYSCGGGGVYCSGSGAVTITNNTLSNNSTPFNGGGIYCVSNSSIISNNTISNNEATSGGGIYCTGSNPIITNNSIINNSAANGGALYCDQVSNPTFRNCILWGNAANTSGAQIFLNDEASDPDFYYCDIQGGSAAFELNGNVYSGIYQNNINTDPQFVSPSGGSGSGYNGISADWSLQSNSPCINTGDPNGTYPATDKVGNPRVTICRIDIGAYEYQNGTPFSATILQTQQILCHGNSTATATINATGGNSIYTYLWSNGQTTATATGLSAGTYSGTVTEGSNGCLVTKTIIINQPPALSLNPTTTNPICTNNNGSSNVVVNGGTSPYSYLWSTNSNDTTNSVTGLSAGTYSVTVIDNNGCTISDSLTLVTQFPSISIVPSITNASCNNDGSVNIIPNGGTAPYSYLWSTGSVSQNLSGIGGGTYSITVTDFNGCLLSDTLTISNSIAPSSIPICMVTVDSTSTKNLIVWEKPVNAPIDSFRIYREVASVYTIVGSVAYTSLSEFTDNTNGINPNTTSYKYKLSILDSCGNESPLSTEHQTIHLQMSLAFPHGVNLNWNDYTGFTFSQYRILRDSIGNGNWQAIDSVSYGINTYTNTDILPNAHYMVEAKNPAPCVSTRQIGNTRNASKSNTATQTTGINELANSQLNVTISPNPTNGKFIIKVSSSRITNNKFEIKIYNVLGEKVFQFSNLSQQMSHEIDLSASPKGIYFVKIYSDKEIQTERIVVQ